MPDIYGFDFGTTNSLASLVVADSARFLLGDDDRPHPSMVWYLGGEVIVGPEAKRRLAGEEGGGAGDVVRSPKRLLGRDDGVFIAGVEHEPAEVVARVLEFVRQHAEVSGWVPLERVVMSIPVTMRGAARRQLRDAALRAGIRIEQFVHEPLAALYGYLRAQDDFRRLLAELEGKLMMVIDWGGGTLDLTLCTFVNRTLIQIQNQGDDTVGGDKFDEQLVTLVRGRHLEAHGIDRPPEELPGAGATLVERCESAKIALSRNATANVFVKDFLRCDGPERVLDVTISREDLLEGTQDLIADGLANVDRLLEQVQRSSASIALCLPTGGITEMPAVRERLLAKFDASRLHQRVRGDLVIAEGAAWIAHDGVEVVLAKSFEVLHADDNFYPVVMDRSPFPRENKVQHYPLGMYCVDPRDGVAHFQFARAVWPGRDLPGHPRKLYGGLRLAVDPGARPLRERIDVGVQLDADLIATVTASSSLAADTRTIEIHDLEFGLAVPSDGADEDDPGELATVVDADVDGGPSPASGAVRLRSNVGSDPEGWDLVPGELMSSHRPGATLTSRQRDESGYYLPCSICDRTIHQIDLEGCEAPGCPAPRPHATQPLRDWYAQVRSVVAAGDGTAIPERPALSAKLA